MFIEFLDCVIFESLNIFPKIAKKLKLQKPSFFIPSIFLTFSDHSTLLQKSSEGLALSSHSSPGPTESENYETRHDTHSEIRFVLGARSVVVVADSRQTQTQTQGLGTTCE